MIEMSLMNFPKTYLMRASVAAPGTGAVRGLFRGVDDEHFHRFVAGDEVEAELVVQGLF